jgi:hypothetical protein
MRVSWPRREEASIEYVVPAPGRIAAKGTLTMDRQTLVTLLVLMVVVAAVVLTAWRKGRDKAAQAHDAAKPKVGAASFPPGEMSDADIRLKLKTVVGGGSWERWPSIPAPHPGATNVRDEVAKDKARPAADPEAPPDEKAEAIDPKPGS